MDIVSHITEDLKNAERELAALEAKAQPLRWRCEYLRKLLTRCNANDNGAQEPVTVAVNGDVSYAKGAKIVLEQTGGSLSIPKIIDGMIERGFLPASVDRELASRNISSALSKAAKGERGIAKRGRGTFEFTQGIQRVRIEETGN